MKSWLIRIVFVCAALFVAGPSLAASRLATLKHIKLDVTMDESGLHYTAKTELPPDSASLSSDNDEAWQLTVGNCVLNIPLNGANLTPADVSYDRHFRSGFSNADNPNQDELNFNARVEVLRRLPGSTDALLPCESRRLYWVSVLRLPRAPGNVAVMLTLIDGYKAQQTEQHVLLFSPGTFLKGNDKTAEKIGGITAAIARSLRK